MEEDLQETKNLTQKGLLDSLFALSKTILKEFDSLTLLPHWPSITAQHKLKSYAYYKQATKGICVDRLKVDEKWITWKRLGNMSKEQAKVAYIRLTIEILTLFKEIPMEKKEVELGELEKRRSGEEWRVWDSLPRRLEELKKVDEIVIIEPISPTIAAKGKNLTTMSGKVMAVLQSLYRPRFLVIILSLFAVLFKFKSRIYLSQYARRLFDLI